MKLRRSLKLGALALYCGALVASWFVMERRPDRAPDDDQRVERWTSEADGGSRTIAIAFTDRGPREAPVVLLLHGSPGAHTDLLRATATLEDRFRCIAPDLPGFGASTAWLDDYSIETHAVQMLELLDVLGIPSAHVIGYSMGGGVGLEMYARSPGRVRSLVMFAAIGTIELELFGDPTLNHGLHQLQLQLLRALRWGVPHFGALDDFPLNVRYARNFVDSDQARLRGLLEAFEPPMLVLHGEEDFLVPQEAAVEHARIVPQAELRILTRADVPELAPNTRLGPSHFLPFRFPELIGGILGDFLDRVEAGAIARRRDASEARLVAASAPFNAHDVPAFQGPALLAIVLLLAIGTLVSEDLACIAAGLLVADGRLGFLAAAGACFLGIFVGDMLLFLAGRFFGRAALQRRPLRWFVGEGAVTRASHWFSERGAAMIFISRLTPGLRLPTYVAAGILRTPILKFATLFAIAGALWVPALVGVASVAGREAAEALGGLGWSKLPWLIGLVVLLRELFGTAPLLFTHRGRRMLRGRWLRRTRWEFWPTWFAYIPVFVYIGWLGLRHRGLGKVTAANPAIPGGGIVGESKAAILRGLGDAPELPPWLLLEAGLEPEERARRAVAFAAHEGLEFPVIVKPDAGQRGSGVRAVADPEALAAAVRPGGHDTLVQARLDGPEFGVFYIRHPEAAVGTVFAITVKVLPTVTGDGARTLEELVLDDPRACALHAVYGRENEARFDLIVPKGEVVELVRVGTHARGAEFLDGRHLITPELTEAVERLSRRYEGFYFGRYDVRVPSAEHLQRGEGLQVIELNGVTSEATNIYDRRVGIWEAYRTLFAQWREAYAIGAYHAARGIPTTGILGVLREWRRYRRDQRGHRIVAE